jgi:hypothetical protein
MYLARRAKGITIRAESSARILVVLEQKAMLKAGSGSSQCEAAGAREELNRSEWARTHDSNLALDCPDARSFSRSSAQNVSLL